MTTMMKRCVCLAVLALLTVAARAADIDDLRRQLEQSARAQVQEKVYIHTDNACYFVGDTLWYKAYVVRADNLQPTDMSRILYVELLSPDGLLVERQHIIVSPQGHTCGQFVLRDSLYSGYYELRAYTRWMLNFNTGHRQYSTHDTWLFYNKQMAADYFRTWEGLYSRVLPVYSKPGQPGDYDARHMYQRPKTRLPQNKKDQLTVTFYPEGGHLIEGVENRVAFEATDQYGEAQTISGTVTAAGQPPLNVRTEYMGRGTFLVTPGAQQLKARFTFRGKQYDLPLPKAEPQGVALRMEGDRLTMAARQLPVDRQYALSVLCRGALRYFHVLPPSFSDHTLPVDSLPTGVNEVTLFDSDGRIWASRLFFVNHHEQDTALIVPDTPQAEQPGDGADAAGRQARVTYQPYERIDYAVRIPGATAPTVFSLSIRDTNTDEPTYDNGNVMTDLLLSSDLRGFIAYPAHYFESDDAEHRRHLDLLMMVQGWRKYKWQELAGTTRELRYQPEKTMTVEGAVYKMLDVNEVEPDEVAYWQQNQGAVGTALAADEEEAAAEQADDGTTTVSGQVADDVTDGTGYEWADMDQVNSHIGVNHGNLRREVLVEAEVVMGREVVAAVQKTRQGRFGFEIPPFYGATYLNLKAYEEKDSVKKSMLSNKDTDAFKETAFPDFYVKRDMLYPVQTEEYSYYQKHAPEWQVTIDEDSLSEWSMENDVHELRNIDVKGHRRGRRAVDWTKPAAMYNAYDVYNDLTDYGLSFGYFDMRQFPRQVATFLYGNMNRYNSFHVDGRLEGAVYWRNYSPVAKGAGSAERAAVFSSNRTPQAVYQDIRLSRLHYVRVYSDYEPRNADSTMVEERYSADATVEMVPIADNGRQVVHRDRHIYLQGFNEPARFYQPDYSSREPGDAPADYRRTLYWNPNAVTDAEGRFTATFYNNGKETRMKMTAAGITRDGQLLHSR